MHKKLNPDDNFVKKIVSCIVSGVTDDIIQDLRQAEISRYHSNSYHSRIWDLINRNVCTSFNNNDDVVAKYTKRGAWTLIVIFDKVTGVLYTIMREERFAEVQKNPQHCTHYVGELAYMFNADLDYYQQRFTQPDYSEDRVKISVERICNDLLLSTDVVKRHAIILFSAKDELLSSIRCVTVNKNFEVCDNASWNDYIGVKASNIVEQVSDQNDKHNQPTLGLSYTVKAKERKKTNEKLKLKSVGGSKEAK